MTSSALTGMAVNSPKCAYMNAHPLPQKDDSQYPQHANTACKYSANTVCNTTPEIGEHQGKNHPHFRNCQQNTKSEKEPHEPTPVPVIRSTIGSPCAYFPGTKMSCPYHKERETAPNSSPRSAPTPPLPSATDRTCSTCWSQGSRRQPLDPRPLSGLQLLQHLDDCRA